MNKKNMTGNAVKKQIKDRVSEGVDTIKKDTKATKRLIKNRVTVGMDTIKKDTKATKRLIKNKVTAGVEIAKDETGEVMGKVKMAASEANRKRKAAVRAIKS
jgi:gas vesicle protein